jgi:hypothetical protein
MNENTAHHGGNINFDICIFFSLSSLQPVLWMYTLPHRQTAVNNWPDVLQYQPARHSAINQLISVKEEQSRTKDDGWTTHRYMTHVWH